MAVEKLEIETYFGKCKCCLKFGYLRPMWDENEDEHEVYGKMLTQCFSIPWTIEISEEDDQICEDCIWKLQEANKFKQQILNCRSVCTQDQKIEVVLEEIKSEPEEAYDVEYLDEDLLHKNVEDSANNEQNGDYDADYLEDIETLDDDDENHDGESDKSDLDEDDDDEEYKESEAPRPTSRKRTSRRRGAATEADTPKSKWPKKLPLEDRWKTYRQYTDDDMKLAIDEVMNKTMSQRQAALKFNVPVKTLSAKIRAIKNSEDTSPSDENEATAIIQKHRENLQSVLAYSNATPIRGFWGMGYVCSICPHQFAKPSELKTHTQKHGDPCQLFKINNVRGHIARLDVTNLICNLCNTKFVKLQSLMKHLKTIHGKPMHFDIDNHMVPFKFDSDLLQCADCTDTFKYCKKLSEHMANKHYRNYICKDCNKGFFNLSHLAGHRETHQAGEFRCSKCGKVFITLRKKSKHERLHVVRGKNFKCKFCEFWFFNATQRYNHELRVHANDKVEFDCSYCDKTYAVLKNLRVHINEVHLETKKHECPVKTCEKSFYLKRTLKAHVKQHDYKRFQCPKCFKMFKSSVTLRDHMPLHTSKRDRKFRCEECDISYLKKDNLNRHMKKHH